MELKQWHEAFSVGVKIVDMQHQRLFSLSNELLLNANAVQQKDVLGGVLDALTDYAVLGFRIEEQYIKAVPGFKEHRKEHLKFSEKVAGFVSAFKLGNFEFGPLVVGFLDNWIKKHVLVTDRLFFKRMEIIDPAASISMQHDSDSYRPGRETILLVHNCNKERRFLKQALEKETLTVLGAKNGADALQLCRDNWDIQVVVVNIRLPTREKGYQFIRDLRSRQLRNIHIIVTDDDAGKKEFKKAFESGADDFLLSPVFPWLLYKQIGIGLKFLKIENQDNFIFSMAKLSDYRSRETGAHLKRVQRYTLEIGMYLAEHHPEKGVSRRMAEVISNVSPIHDIGKVAVSDDILKKRGPLSDEEFEIMKEHTTIGGDLISDIYLKTGARHFRIAFELTMYHHEKWDGSGYPAGLSGNSIPIAARIMAIADVYDALTTERVYKKAFSHSRAKQIIVKGSGRHFDPDLVSAFLAVERRFIQLKNEIGDEDTEFTGLPAGFKLPDTNGVKELNLETFVNGGLSIIDPGRQQGVVKIHGAPAVEI